MADPIVRDQIPWLAKWSALAARSYDFSDGGGSESRVLTLTDLAKGKGDVRGRKLLTGALWVTDLAVAQQAMLHGDLTAYISYKCLWDEEKKHFVPESQTERESVKFIRGVFKANSTTGTICGLHRTS